MEIRRSNILGGSKEGVYRLEIKYVNDGDVAYISIDYSVLDDDDAIFWGELDKITHFTKTKPYSIVFVYESKDKDSLKTQEEIMLSMLEEELYRKRDNSKIDVINYGDAIETLIKKRQFIEEKINQRLEELYKKQTNMKGVWMRPENSKYSNKELMVINEEIIKELESLLCKRI